jgi:hypothetical protein
MSVRTFIQIFKAALDVTDLGGGPCRRPFWGCQTQILPCYGSWSRSCF